MTLRERCIQTLGLGPINCSPSNAQIDHSIRPKLEMEGTSELFQNSSLSFRYKIEIFASNIMYTNGPYRSMNLNIETLNKFILSKL